MRSKLMTAFTSLVVSTPLIAHPGHDHSSVESGLVHAIFALSLLGSVALVAMLAKKKLAKKTAEKKS